MSKKLVVCIASGHPNDGYVAIPGQVYMVTDTDYNMDEYEISRPGWSHFDRCWEPIQNFTVVNSLSEALEAINMVAQTNREAAEKIYGSANPSC